MANTLKIVQIMDGPTDVVYRVFMKSDGSGEIVNQAVIDPANLKGSNARDSFVPAGKPAGRCFNIQQIWYNFSAGFNVILSFAATPNNEVMILTPSVDSYLDLRPASGVPDNTPDNQIPTGTLLMTTDGFSSFGQYGFFIIKVRKMK